MFRGKLCICDSIFRVMGFVGCFFYLWFCFGFVFSLHLAKLSHISSEHFNIETQRMLKIQTQYLGTDFIIFLLFPSSVCSHWILQAIADFDLPLCLC